MWSVGHIPGTIAISAALLSPIPAKLIVIGCGDSAPTDHASGSAFAEGTLASFKYHDEILALLKIGCRSRIAAPSQLSIFILVKASQRADRGPWRTRTLRQGIGARVVEHAVTLGPYYDSAAAVRRTSSPIYKIAVYVGGREWFRATKTRVPHNTCDY